MSLIASSTLPKISVAMPVYNRADWIARTLDCIFSQSLQPFEVVLCDDGSTDHLSDALAPYREKITLLRIENSGPGIARKTAIEASTGDWIALCDSDDFWLPNHLERFYQAFQLMPELHWYFSNFKQTDDGFVDKFYHAPAGWLDQISEPFIQVQSLPLRSLKLPEVFKALVDYQACFQTAMVFSRSLYDIVGGIAPEISRIRSEDAHLTWRLALQKAPGALCTEPTVLINKHDDNYSASYRDNLLGEINILSKIKFSINDKESKSFIDKACIEKWLEVFRFSYWEKDSSFIKNNLSEFPFRYFTLRDWVRLIRAYITVV